MQPDDYAEITYHVKGKIATLALNVPEKRNRLSFQMRREIVDALKRADRDDEASVVLIVGNGPSFCAGYDLMPDPGERLPDAWNPSEEFAGWSDQFPRAAVQDWLTIWDLMKPVVAMVHGNCLAGGTEVMSMCDIVFVADDARIGYPPMRSQATPDLPYFPWKMSMAHAKYYQITGNSVTGKQAADMGWVAKSFPPEELLEATQRELRAMVSISPSLLAANKHSVNQAYELMGIRTHILDSWYWHSIGSQLRPDAGRFGRTKDARGLRAALDERDGPFNAEGLL
jgi:enoyl-CoA hydratase